MEMEIQAQDKHIVVNGLRFHYREWGSSNSPALFIFHGLTGHSWEFDNIAAALADQFHILVVDQRGHGDSSWADEYSPDLMAADINGLVSSLTNNSVRLIGHSMGGVNCWRYTAMHPEQVEQVVIIDIDPKAICSEKLVRVMISTLEAFSKAKFSKPEDAVRDYLVNDSSSQELRDFVINNLKQDSDGNWIWRFDAQGLNSWMKHASASEDFHRSAIRQIPCSTLVIRAGNSPFTNMSDMKRMVEEMPQARLVEIINAGHDIHIDQREALITELRSFLMV